MIEVKGTKTTAAEADASQLYVLKSMEKKSKAPFVVGAFLTGMAVYLKSIFPAWDKTPEGGPSPQEERTGAVLPEMARVQPLEPFVPEVVTGNVPGELPVGSSGRLLHLQAPVELIKVESPNVDDFFPVESSIDWNGPPLSSPIASAANDNLGEGDGPTGDDPVGPEDTVDSDDPVDPKVPNDPEERVDPEEPVDPEVPVDPEDPVDPCACDDDDENPRADNRAPRVAGPVYLMDVTGCVALVIALSDLLRNATDPDGDVLSVEGLTVSSGTLTHSAGTWVFQPGPQLLGPVTVTYQVTDGDLSAFQTAHFNVLETALIVGTDCDDLILGTMCSDDIEGGAGDDNIDGRAGNDVISGGDGDDHIVAGEGDDVIFGGNGHDVIFTGAGNDYVSGGNGNDRLFGEAGDDIMFGEAGDDLLMGGDGDDLLAGGIGDDFLSGDAGNDALDGGAGADIVSGGSGADVLDGGSGNDNLEGGEGNDVLMDGSGEDQVSGGLGDDHVMAALDGDDDIYDGGSGRDTLDYSATQEGVAIELAQGTAVGRETGSDSLSGFEEVIGGSGDDRLAGGEGDESLLGGAGDDEIEGNGGDDMISDGSGSDAVSGGSGDDTLMAAMDAADDVYDGGEGRDTLDYSGAQESLVIDLESGTASGIEIGEDGITGFEELIGGSGDDHFIVAGGSVTLEGGAGEDVFEFVAPGPEAGDSPAAHEIVDFRPGDLVRMSKWDIFEEVFDRLEDQFEAIYGDRVDEDDAQIRYSHEWVDDVKRTIIEADFDNNDIYETSIVMDGHRALVVFDHA